MYLEILPKYNWQHPNQPKSCLTKADAAVVAALIGGLTEPDADDIEQLDRILAAAYSAAPAPPGTFTETVQEHGGLAVARAVQASFSLSGRPCQDIVQAAADITAEAAEDGTWRTGPPLFPEDDLRPETSQTAEVIVTDDPVVAEPAIVEDEPPGQVAPAAQDSLAAGYDWDYADDWRGDISALELTEAEEDYRRRAYEAALHYAADYGLSLIPVYWMATPLACVCRDGESCLSAGKHPCDLRWPEMATADPEQAARWWRPLEPGETLPVDWRPQANVGAVMGEKYFITDVDTDAGKQGEESLARLVAEHGEAMPATLTYQTGGGGRQYVLLVPEGIEVRSSASKLASGIDIKGYNGYGILPPSQSGKGEYRMLDDRSPDVCAPAWEADWLTGEHRQRTEHIRAHPAGDPRQIPQEGLTKRAHAYITAAFADAVAKVAAAEERTRNTTLNDECFDLFAKFVPAGLLSADDIAAAMQDAGEACGLGSGAVFATIQSAWNGGQKKDRSHELPDFLFEVPGKKDESGIRILPHPGTPIKVARVIAATDLATPQGLPSLRWHRGGFARWDGRAWLGEPDSAIEQQLFLITEHAKYEERDDEDDGGEVRIRSWNPAPGSIATLLKTLGVAVLQLPHRLDPPFWITTGAEERGLIPLGNGLLDAVTRELSPHTPDYFNAWSLPYDYDPDAPEPADWLKFLADLWPDAPESIAFLQEWMGYLISGDTSQEKVCLLTGPRRGGKGTICKVVIALMGAMNIASPTFTNLTETFGLESLVDKPLAIIFDARTGNKNIQSAVERMLTISGRDRVTVNRKNRAAWEGQLPARLMHVSNELPALRDVSAALASRYIPLTTTKSWLGQEDVGLGPRLTTPESLSAILNWALTGLDRLREKGTFTMPAGATEALAMLERLASPEMAWAEECCEFDPDLWAKTDALFASYERWAVEDQRMTKTPVKEVFTRNLRAAFPELVPSRRRLGGEKQHHGYSGVKLLAK